MIVQHTNTLVNSSSQIGNIHKDLINYTAQVAVKTSIHNIQRWMSIQTTMKEILQEL